jgi:hypothetical protein
VTHSHHQFLDAPKSSIGFRVSILLAAARRVRIISSALPSGIVPIGKRLGQAVSRSAFIFHRGASKRTGKGVVCLRAPLDCLRHRPHFGLAAEFPFSIHPVWEIRA